MGLMELILLTLPLLIIVAISILNFMIFIKTYINKEESTLFHVALVFFFTSIIFLILALASFIPTQYPLVWFLLGHVVAWIIFLEIANSYFSAFLNRSRAVERYVLPIFGATIGLSVFGIFNQEFYLFATPIGIEAGIFLLGMLSLLYIFMIAYERMNVLHLFEGEEFRLLALTRRIFVIGSIAIGYTFISVISWLIIKDISNLSLEIIKWEPIDWIVYINIPIYFILLLGALIEYAKLNFEEIDIQTVLNIIDSPQG